MDLLRTSSCCTTYLQERHKTVGGETGNAEKTKKKKKRTSDRRIIRTLAIRTGGTSPMSSGCSSNNNPHHPHSHYCDDGTISRCEIKYATIAPPNAVLPSPDCHPDSMIRSNSNNLLFYWTLHGLHFTFRLFNLLFPLPWWTLISDLISSHLIPQHPIRETRDVNTVNRFLCSYPHMNRTNIEKNQRRITTTSHSLHENMLWENYGGTPKQPLISLR